MTAPSVSLLLPDALAAEFSKVLRSQLAPEEMALVIERNRTREAGVCHSHDFCDANMVMLEAWERTIAPYDGGVGHTQAEQDLWARAWDIAIQTEFRTTLEPADAARLILPALEGRAYPGSAFCTEGRCRLDPERCGCAAVAEAVRKGDRR